MSTITPIDNVKTYAQARLMMGITTVGFWVVASTLALWLELPALFTDWSFQQTLFTVLGVYIGVSAPFDVTGGYLLPKHYGRWTETFTTWLTSWVRGVLAQSVIMSLSAFALWSLFQASDAMGIWLAVVVLVQVVFAAGQTVMAAIEGNYTPTDTANLWHSNDIGFTGGINLLGQSTLSEQWQDNLSHHEWGWLNKRRELIVSSGANVLGALGAVAFNTVGFWLVVTLNQLQFATSADWVTLLLGQTLWAFLGVLILPSLGQRAVLTVDGHCENSTAAHTLIKTLDSFQDEEPSRHPWVQRIFHPLPSVHQRLENLKQQSAQTNQGKPIGFWHINRRMLFYSWPMMNLINRAVHCNVGRPDCWVFLPTEG